MSVVVSTPDPGLIGKFYMQMSKEICLHKFFFDRTTGNTKTGYRSGKCFLTKVEEFK